MSAPQVNTEEFAFDLAREKRPTVFANYPSLASDPSAFLERKSEDLTPWDAYMRAKEAHKQLFEAEKSNQHIEPSVSELAREERKSLQERFAGFPMQHQVQAPSDPMQTQPYHPIPVVAYENYRPSGIIQRDSNGQLFIPGNPPTFVYIVEPKKSSAKKAAAKKSPAKAK